MVCGTFGAGPHLNIHSVGFIGVDGPIGIGEMEYKINTRGASFKSASITGKNYNSIILVP